jgi:beta-lactamase class D
MKTKNNVQKTFLRSIAVITSFVLLSLTVTAQGYWKQLLTNNSFIHIASALVGHSSNVSDDRKEPVHETELNTYFSYFYETEEKTFEPEAWMLKSDYFINYSNATDIEPDMEIRDWMSTGFFDNAEKAQEESLQLEPWMVQTDFWN